MIETYPSGGSHNRTRDYEKEVDCAFRDVELPLKTSRALSGYSYSVGATPSATGQQLFSEWLQRNAEELSVLDEVDEGYPWGEWRLPRNAGEDEMEQRGASETIHQTLSFTYDSLLGIVKYAAANQIPPARLTSDIILKGLQEAAS